MMTGNFSGQGRVIWISGLSGAGKTTTARALLPLLPPPCLLLDGDAMREALALLAGGYEPQDRLKLALTYGRLCLLAAGQEQTVVCATVSMFHEVHQWNRDNLPGYFEVFLDPPPETIAERDYKKVYQPGRGPVTGAHFAAQTPLRPHLHLRDPAATPEENARLIALALNSQALIKARQSHNL